jgi:putative DNA primase/helicase
VAAAAIRSGVPNLTARYHKFRDELFKQFVCDGHLPPPPESDTTLINLKNGTFEISETTLKLRKPEAADFLKYQLPFEYQQAATAPMFMVFLARVLPEPELQAILAEYVGYVFVVGLKLEKVLLLYGTGANGKSVVFDSICALLGRENVSSYSLSSLTKVECYQRAELQNKLLNYASELTGNLESSMFKQLVSGEPVEARQIYGRPFMMRRYARLMFNCNELPHDVENTDAFFRRFIIVPFQQSIPENEQDPELAKKIIAAELPGIFNWVLGGLQRLLRNRRFTESDIVRKMVEEYKKESDSVAMFIEDMRYHPSTIAIVAVGVFYTECKGFCQENGYRALGKKKFTKRCRALGFEIVKESGHVVYAERRFY